MMSGLRDGPEEPANAEPRKRRVPSCDTAGHSVEKRRCEQGSQYMEELAELLSTNLPRVDSLHMMPDRGRILHRTLQQIQLTKRLEQGKAAEDEVQRTDISLGSQCLIEKDSLGPLLLEALDGFLFVVNAEGRMVFVSENVTMYLGYSQEELMNTSVYSILHLGDQAEFTNNLLPKAQGNSGPWSEVSSEPKSCTFQCRMLGRAAPEAVGEEAGLQYQLMECLSMSQPRSAALQSCLICVARRLLRPQLTPESEPFITKQDTTGKIISIDATALRASGRVGWEDMVRRCIHAFFEPQDQKPSYVKQLLQEVLMNGAATSVFYRFSLSDGTILRAQTKCKLCYPINTGSQPIIMGLHSVYREQSLAAAQRVSTTSPPVPRCSVVPPRTSPSSSTSSALDLKPRQVSSSPNAGASSPSGLRSLPAAQTEAVGLVTRCSSTPQSGTAGTPGHNGTGVAATAAGYQLTPAQGRSGSTFSPGASCVPSSAEHLGSDANQNHAPNLSPSLNQPLLSPPTGGVRGLLSYPGALSLPAGEPVEVAARGRAWCGAKGGPSFKPMDQGSASTPDTCQDIKSGKLMQLLTSRQEQSGQGERQAGTGPGSSDHARGTGSVTEQHRSLQQLLHERRRRGARCGQELRDQPLLRRLLDKDEPTEPGLSLDNVKLETPSGLATCTPGKLEQFTDLDQLLPSLEEAVQLSGNSQKNGTNGLASRGRREQLLDPLHSKTVTKTLQCLKKGLPDLDERFRGNQLPPCTRGDEPPCSSGTDSKEEGSSFRSQLDELLWPPRNSEVQDDEKELLDQLVSFLSAKDEVELVEIDRALGIDKLIQSGDFTRLQDRTPAPPYLSMEPKPVTQQQQQIFAACPPYSAAIQHPGLVRQQHLVFRSMPGQLDPGAAYPSGGGLSLCHVTGCPSSVTNQLRLQLQQRLLGQQGPLNAQMVAQRQREYISHQHRQQQMMQQQALLMRHQVPHTGAQLTRSSPSQTTSSPSYSACPANSPPPPSPFSPLAPGSHSHFGLCSSLPGSPGVQVTTGLQSRELQHNICPVPTSDVGLAPTPYPSSPTTSPLIEQAAAPTGYDTPERKVWQQDALGRNSVQAGAGQQPPLCNNVHITVSMDTEPGSISNRVSGQMHLGTVQLPSIGSVCPEQVQQVQVFADVQCTVNVLGGDSYMNHVGPMGSQKGQGSGLTARGQQSLLQQLLTD